jgi:hypothetical protein
MFEHYSVQQVFHQNLITLFITTSHVNRSKYYKRNIQKLFHFGCAKSCIWKLLISQTIGMIDDGTDIFHTIHRLSFI